MTDPTPPISGSRAAGLIAVMCLAEMLGMAGIFAFPALLPRFLDQWHLTHTQAGWINGIYFVGYTTAVPVLAGLTDRIDGRRIYLLFTVVGGLAAVGFAWLAQGFWTALVLRALAGLGLAGTFIPGLKALVDRLEGRTQARAISFYTATFSLGTALSFFATGHLERWFGWRAAFAFGAACSLAALLIAALALKPRAPGSDGQPAPWFPDFRPVLKNRRAMAYILAYATHTWELFSLRSWSVAFLTFSLSLQPDRANVWVPSNIVALMAVVSMSASIGGAELALRFGRLRILTLVMWGSALIGAGIGFTAGMPYPLVVGLLLVYALFVQGDSAVLHTGAVQSADPRRRGAAMALQSLIGFTCAGLGPLAVGTVLDLTGGGNTSISWGLAFLAMGSVVAAGPIFVAFLGGRHHRPE